MRIGWNRENIRNNGAIGTQTMCPQILGVCAQANEMGHFLIEIAQLGDFYEIGASTWAVDTLR